MQTKWIVWAYANNGEPRPMVSISEVTEVADGLYEMSDGGRRRLLSFEQVHPSLAEAEVAAAAMLDGYAAVFAAKAAELREAAAASVASAQIVSV